MRRKLLALALVGTSAIAVAAPLNTPFSGPADVKVINAATNPVPVAVTPGPLPALAKIGDRTLTLDATGENVIQIACTSIEMPMRITGVSVRSVGAKPHTADWYLVLLPIGSTGVSDEINVAAGTMDSKAVGPNLYVHRASMTLPVNVVTAGYDKLCIRGQRSGTFSVDLTYSAIGELL